MNHNIKYPIIISFLLSFGTLVFSQEDIPTYYYGNNKEWFIENIPFIDVPDRQIMDVYYYRWEMYKRHLRNIGEHGYVITEFAPSVPWEGPYSTIVAAAGHHIYEGRWIKDKRYLDDYIDFWYKGFGNQFQYSSWLNDAIYKYHLIKGDNDWIKSYLPAMIADYQGWTDKRFDKEKGMFWQKPTEDATEYTVSGYMVGEGWAGDAYRPTINAYMYANAQAIREVALLKGDITIAEKFNNIASELKKRIQEYLWNGEIQQFMDRFTDRYADKGLSFEFINAPEINGYVPWMFNLPDDNQAYIQSWEKLLDENIFFSPYGPRTIDARSPYYMLESRTPGAKPGLGECEWNGPSWPYQTCQVLMGMANVLHNYNQDVITKDDYFTLLKIYTQSQYKNCKPYIAENLNPDTGEWIADFPNRSENYNHSTYNDLILTGLLGIHPRGGDSIILEPLIPDCWTYFSVKNITYHGHNLDILYDKAGTRYNKGKGLHVYVNGELAYQSAELKKHTICTPSARKQEKTNHIFNYAFNDKGEGYPKASASFTNDNENPYEAIDGRTWFDEFPHNRWTTLGSTNENEWFEVDLGKPKVINTVHLSFYEDGSNILLPENFVLEYWTGRAWKEIARYSNPIAGCTNKYKFNPVETSQIRIVFPTVETAVGIVEIEIGRRDITF